jgi:FkbM family methyltransferase
MLIGANEPLTRTWFRVKPGEIVVDVGAHIGRYTLLGARHASQVVAVEPDPWNFSLLERNVRLNGFSNVTAFNLAMSSASGTLPFYIARTGDTDISSLSGEWAKDLGVTSNTESVEVKCETLDGLVSSLPFISWLKIDVEGHEVAVLEGGSAALAKTKRLILEVQQKNEEACKRLCHRAGLTLLSIEKFEGRPLSFANWLLMRTA